MTLAFFPRKILDLKKGRVGAPEQEAIAQRRCGLAVSIKINCQLCAGRPPSQASLHPESLGFASQPHNRTQPAERTKAAQASKPKPSTLEQTGAMLG
jgi:hypothetical protein